ncbi:MAG: hypothetical protein KGY50_02870 [Candidatus Thermoplasmatota archaeon]|nr:hypothetical protein [Candidatus Thermoplasmatota archaeon]
MQYYLITKWFGCFLVNKKGSIVKKEIFTYDEDELKQKVSRIRNNQILEEEQGLAHNTSLFVAEKRLESLGEFQPSKPVFLEFQPNPEEFGFSLTILHTVLRDITDHQVDHALANPDYQVIQQVNALDELQHIANVLSERITAWNMYPTTKAYQKPVTTVLDTVEKKQDELKQQIESAINDLAPNMSEIVGPMISARLLSHAGSLRKLAMLPSSSIQLLGAEKALFRFKKKGGKPPKHGVIFQHPYISKVPFKKRGKNARLLSAKIAIAAKADMFTKRFIAPILKEELSNQIKK